MAHCRRLDRWNPGITILNHMGLHPKKNHEHIYIVSSWISDQFFCPSPATRVRQFRACGSIGCGIVPPWMCSVCVCTWVITRHYILKDVFTQTILVFTTAMVSSDSSDDEVDSGRTNRSPHQPFVDAFSASKALKGAHGLTIVFFGESMNFKMTGLFSCFTPKNIHVIKMISYDHGSRTCFYVGFLRA